VWNKPSVEELSKIPKFYSTEEVPLKEKICHVHFFIGGCDWFGFEFDEDSQTFFGFAILNNDYDNAEWGYFSLEELCSLKVDFVEVDRDLHFTPTKAMKIETIRKAQGWELEKVEVAAQNPKQEGGE